MIHLTQTGNNAGHPLCNCHRAAHKAMGDLFVAVRNAPDSLLDSEDLCLGCKEAFESRVYHTDVYPTEPIYWLGADEVAPSIAPAIE